MFWKTLGKLGQLRHNLSKSTKSKTYTLFRNYCKLFSQPFGCLDILQIWSDLSFDVLLDKKHVQFNIPCVDGHFARFSQVVKSVGTHLSDLEPPCVVFFHDVKLRIRKHHAKLSRILRGHFWFPLPKSNNRLLKLVCTVQLCPDCLFRLFQLNKQ